MKRWEPLRSKGCVGLFFGFFVDEIGTISITSCDSIACRVGANTVNRRQRESQ